MKRNYVMMAMAAAMLASCAQTGLVEEIAEEPQKAISFSTFVDKATRAENSDESYEWDIEDHHNSYFVYGYKTVDGVNSDVFTGQEVTSATGVYSPTKYWDMAATSYGFFAYAGDDVFTKNQNGTIDYMSDDYFTIAGFTLPATNLNSTSFGSVSNSFKTSFEGKDLMIAAECNHTSIGSNVTLNFIHILSRLNVMVKTDFLSSSENYIQIKAVEVHNLVADGVFNESTEPTTPATLASGTTVRWTRMTSSTTVDNKYNHTGQKIDATATSQYVIQALVMPQIAGYQQIDIKGTDAESSAKPYIKITYSVTTGGVQQPDCTYYYNLADAFGDSDLAFNEGWQNNLTIKISPSNIAFDGKVAKWDDGTTKNDFSIE